MILRDRYDGGSSPLEGDRELVLRRLPSDARVVRARATVIPVDPGARGGGGEPFVETLSFQGNLGDWGTTKSASTAGGWVEVDFHARRTVVGLSGQLGGNVQADLGGGFVPIGIEGTFLVPPQAPLPVSGSSAVLPSLTATRLRLFGTPNQALDVTAVRVRSAPSGVRLGLQGRPALWFHTGELTRPETTPDFGAVLQAYLDDAGEAADTENGVWLLPFVLHSDALGRLAVELEIEYLRRVSVLPGGVQDAALSFDHGGLPRSGGALGVSLPGDARVAGGSGRVAGAFESTRVAFGPVGAVAPVGALTVAPGSSPAHPVVLPAAVEAVAVDLLLSAVTRTARLQLDLRLNLDGKPAGESILPAPVVFPLDREMAGQPTWISVPLAAPLQLRPGQEKTYWLVVQSLEGEAAWSVESMTGTLPPMQLTQDGGFSWRRAALAEGPVSGLFRLRTLPGTFKMPIELRVGSGQGERRVSLARFEPQGRVDLSLDLPEIATAFNEALESAPGRCPEAEHLVNGGFEQWIRTGNVLGRRTTIPLTTDDSFDEARVAVTPDGRTALVATSNDSNEVELRFVDLDRETVVETVRVSSRSGGSVAGLLLDPGGTRAWVALRSSIWGVDLLGRRSLFEPLPLASDTDSGTAFGMTVAAVLSSDGGTLYVAQTSFQTAGSSGRVIALDVRALEAAALRGEPNAASAVRGDMDLPVVSPAGLAVSPDGARLHVLVSTADATSRTEVVPIQTGAFRRRDDQVRDVGTSTPRALAFTPDGRLVVVLDDQVVPETGTAITVPAEQAAVAVDTDGSRAFVVGEDGLTIVDLRRRTASAPLPLASPVAPVSDVAVSPGGDRVVAVIPSSGTLVSIPVGPSVPAVWTVTSGRVQRWAEGGIGPAVLLGDIRETAVGTANRRGPVSVATVAVSQVVPVAAGCTYELSFAGLATERDAVAEVLWKTNACGTDRTDTVAITPIDRTREEGPAFLPVHRTRLQAPAGAAQAEVRFRAPAGVVALVDNASFRGTAASVVNGELTGAGIAGLPEPWQVSPRAATGVSVVSQGDGLRLRNAGTREAAVSQEIELGDGRDFLLEVQARSVAGPSAQSAQAARIEVRWLPADTAVSWELPVEGFEGLSAGGTAPEGTIRAELRLVVPPGTAMDVRSVDLRFPEPAQVPVTFVAQAPGEMAVLGWELLYDRVPGTRPPVPAGGLCVPERPPLAAGEKSADEGCCCDEEAPSMAAAFGGPAAPVATPVTTIPGIGAGRNRLLREAGMDNLQALAGTSPDALREVLPGTPQRVAVEIILAARRSLRRG